MYLNITTETSALAVIAGMTNIPPEQRRGFEQLAQFLWYMGLSVETNIINSYLQWTTEEFNEYIGQLDSERRKVRQYRAICRHKAIRNAKQDFEINWKNHLTAGSTYELAAYIYALQIKDPSLILLFKNRWSQFKPTTRTVLLNAALRHGYIQVFQSIPYEPKDLLISILQNKQEGIFVSLYPELCSEIVDADQKTMAFLSIIQGFGAALDIILEKSNSYTKSSLIKQCLEFNSLNPEMNYVIVKHNGYVDVATNSEWPLYIPVGLEDFPRGCTGYMELRNLANFYMLEGLQRKEAHRRAYIMLQYFNNNVIDILDYVFRHGTQADRPLLSCTGEFELNPKCGIVNQGQWRRMLLRWGAHLSPFTKESGQKAPDQFGLPTVSKMPNQT